MSYGDKIAGLRKEKGMTQAELGEKLSVTYQAVSKWERNESDPDFATMSKMAKIFEVPLEYFGSDDGEDAKAVGGGSAAVNKNNERELLGVCKQCGNVVYKGDEGVTTPQLMCKSCYAAQEKKKRDERQRAVNKLLADRADRTEEARKQRRRGFFWGSLAGGAVLAIAIAVMVYSPDWETALGGIILTALTFFMVTQCFWDGAVASVASVGGVVIGTPGIIFDFDLDGFIFLIAMKILFAVVRMLVLVITTLFFVFVAAIISPFTFVPALLRVNSEIRGEEAALPDLPEND